MARLGAQGRKQHLGFNMFLFKLPPPPLPNAPICKSLKQQKDIHHSFLVPPLRGARSTSEQRAEASRCMRACSPGRLGQASGKSATLPISTPDVVTRPGKAGAGVLRCALAGDVTLVCPGQCAGHGRPRAKTASSPRNRTATARRPAVLPGAPCSVIM